jgi:hypothetical protein
LTISILEHHTSFDAAEKILWYREIFGGASISETSHERRPHFHLQPHRKDGNATPNAQEISLLFETEMPAKDNIPKMGVVNTHWHDTKFWQATVHEGQTIKFVGVTDLLRNSVVPDGAGRFLRRLIEFRKGSMISTAIQPPGTVSYKEQPWGLDRLLFTLLGRGKTP